MDEYSINFSLSFEGNDADLHEIDFYDVAQALVGFQRSLAISTNLVLTGNVITHAPALKGAKIIAVPPSAGSWKFDTKVVIFASMTALYTVTTAPTNTPLGNLVSSAYDYVISESLGFHVDYNKTLGVQIEEMQKRCEQELPHLDESRFDSAIEKCERAIKDMHRPIVESESASSAKIVATYGKKKKPLEHSLDWDSYEYLNYTTQSEELYEFTGRVSSYNVNTFKGRIYVLDEKRPVPFILADSAKNTRGIAKITNSLSLNARERMRKSGDIQRGTVKCLAYKFLSRTGRLKALLIIEVLR